MRVFALLVSHLTLVGAFLQPIPPISVRFRFLEQSCIAKTELQSERGEGTKASRRTFVEQALIVTAGLVYGGEAASAKVVRVKDGPRVTLPSGVSYVEMSIGDGDTPNKGDRVAVHYSLFCNGFQVESSRESSGLAARPLGFDFGAESGPGSVPLGMQQGIEGMKVGGRRKITVPPELAFGLKGRPPFIPGNAVVMFDVSLWSVKRAGRNANITLGGSSNTF